MSNYREMLEDYRDVDIDELMKGLTEDELKKRFWMTFLGLDPLFADTTAD